MNLNTYGQVTNARWIPIKSIHPSPFQARTDYGTEEMEQLTASIKARGMDTPIKVRPRTRGGFEIVFGHRRHEAAKRAGLKELPALVVEMADTEAAEALLSENLDRKDFTDWEAANGIVNLGKLYAEHGQELSESQLARHLNRSRTFVRNAYELLGLTPELAEAAKQTTNAKSALLLVAREVDKDDHREFAERIVAERPSFKKVEKLVADYKAEKELKAASQRPDSPTRKALNRATSRQVEARTMVRDMLKPAEAATRQITPWLEELSPDDYAAFQDRLEVIKRRVAKW